MKIMRGSLAWDRHAAAIVEDENIFTSSIKTPIFAIYFHKILPFFRLSNGGVAHEIKNGYVVFMDLSTPVTLLGKIFLCSRKKLFFTANDGRKFSKLINGTS